MTELSMKEFLNAPESILNGAVADDEFVKVKTKSGNAVIISESEWNILIGAMKIAMNSK